jgi:hypothetical protein
VAQNVSGNIQVVSGFGASESLYPPHQNGMITPARLLLNRLTETDYPILRQDGRWDRCTLAQARYLASRGMIEGKGPASGVIKSLAMRAEDDPSLTNASKTDALDDAIAVDQDTESKARNSHIPIGVYRQALSCVTVDDEHRVTDEGETVAHVYAFELLRGRKEQLAGL